MDHRDHVIAAYEQQLAASQKQLANIMAAANVRIEEMTAELAAAKAELAAAPKKKKRALPEPKAPQAPKAPD